MDKGNMKSKNEFVIFYYNLQRPQDYGFDAAIIKESVDENFELTIYKNDRVIVRKDHSGLEHAIVRANKHCTYQSQLLNWTKIKRINA